MAINLQRRKAVMARSIKLGHCVCNPQQGCPCDTFKQHNVCPCAGEKMPVPSGPVLLTHYVRKAGCASKIGQADLKRILSQLPPITDPNVLLGAAAGDDAGVYRLNDRLSLVQTVDVFTPCVDDAYLFGQIAAANSLSDIYAMGGRPMTALSIIGFPIDDLDGSIMEALVRGGMDKLQEAGCSLIGGHSLQDEEVKCGFAITGLIYSQAAVVRDNAQPGDVLVLTKPLGTGMISFAAQIGRMDPECLSEAGAMMATLNKDAAELMVKHQAHACTDITGFGLLGHLVEMARNSGVMVELDMSALPVYAAAGACLANEILSGAIERNQEYAMAWVDVLSADHAMNLPILYDPQTSGGLLIALPESAAHELVAELRARGHSAASVVGRVKAKPDPQHEARVTINNTQLANFVGRQPAEHFINGASAPIVSPSQPDRRAQEQSSCCDGLNGQPMAIPPPPQSSAFATVTASAPAAESHDARLAGDAFMDFLKLANEPGCLDQRSKKLMAIALSVSQRCKPCLASHLKSAQALGISQAEIDEAAWLGIAFAGSPAMMLYKEVCREIRTQGE